MPSLTFLGAAGTVTGSKHLLDLGSRRVLVDCGLFQGLKDLRLRNWSPFPIEASAIDTIVLTHAHLDHCGYLPRLVAQGFRGRVFCTPGTQDLCSLVLPDSAHLQEEEARDANRHGYAKHQPALPLYTSEDAARALTLFQPVGFNRPVPVVAGVEVEFLSAGHLLGSAYARVRPPAGRPILFGGDLGRYGRPVLPDPSPVDSADVVLVESTYGDRLHSPDDGGARLAAIINDTVARGGKLIIPSFALGRVEEVLYWLKHIEDAKRIPPPARGVSAFATRRLTVIASPQQSKELVASRQPSIVIASSGMATGGRVIHHLEATLPSAKNTVLFVGFQADGTRGRTLVDGIKQVRMKGRDIPVAARIERIDSMSAHADAAEIMRWLSLFSRPPSMTYLVHGESVALETLRARVQNELHWPVHVARYQERVEL